MRMDSRRISTMRVGPARSLAPASVPALTALALATMLFIAALPARAQELPASCQRAASEPLPDTAEESAAGVQAEIEAPREMMADEADRSLAAREKHLREVYDDWQAGADEANALEAPAQMLAEEVPAGFELPPQPDAPGGEITLEREQQERQQQETSR